MEGIGLLVAIAFMLLILAIFTNTCSNWSALEGFEDKKVISKVVKSSTIYWLQKFDYFLFKLSQRGMLNLNLTLNYSLNGLMISTQSAFKWASYLSLVLYSRACISLSNWKKT